MEIPLQTEIDCLNEYLYGRFGVRVSPELLEKIFNEIMNKRNELGWFTEVR